MSVVDNCGVFGGCFGGSGRESEMPLQWERGQCVETVRIRKCQCCRGCPMPPAPLSILVLRPWLRPFANRFANTNSPVRTSLTIIAEMVMGVLGFDLFSPM